MCGFIKCDEYVIEKIKVPIQMIHGVNDPRCPVEESRQFRDKLIEMGWKEGKEGRKHTNMSNLLTKGMEHFQT